MSPQELAFALIKVFEGCKLIAYKDSGDVWTIGFGHTGLEVKEGLIITSDQALDYFKTDSLKLFDLVRLKPLHSQAALVSFGYNCGFNALKLVLEGKAELKSFVHDKHGNVLPGLVSRRELEFALIESDN